MSSTHPRRQALAREARQKDTPSGERRGEGDAVLCVRDSAGAGWQQLWDLPGRLREPGVVASSCRLKV